MFKYTLIRNAEILVVSHYGKYVGAEADEAILSILKAQTLAERRRLKFVIQDFFAVEEMGLRDTDVARRSYPSLEKLSELFDTQDPEAIFAHRRYLPDHAGTCRYFGHAQTERLEARAIPRLPNSFNTEKITG